MDIDGFKQINDLYGHQLGDEALRPLARRLQSVLRDSDTVGRLGGDEFVMLIDPVDRIGAERVANRVLRVLSKPIKVLPAAGTLPGHDLGEHRHRQRVADTAEDLLQDADIAMYQAKAGGKGGYVVFEASMQAATADRPELELDLSEALDAEEFYLAYQPILNSRAAGRVRRGAPALAASDPRRDLAGCFHSDRRGQRHDRPDRSLGAGQACSSAHRLAKGHTIGVSVNVSPRQFERPEFIDEVAPRSPRAARPRLADPRGHRGDAGEPSCRDGGAAAELKPLGVRSRSTISVPATARWAICASFRSTRSSSTAVSSRASPALGRPMPSRTR